MHAAWHGVSMWLQHSILTRALPVSFTCLVCAQNKLDKAIPMYEEVLRIRTTHEELLPWGLQTSAGDVAKDRATDTNVQRIQAFCDLFETCKPAAIEHELKDLGEASDAHPA